MRFKLTSEKREELRNAGEASIVGWVLVISILIGVFLGSWYDRAKHTAPTGVTVGVVVGAAAGFRNLFKVVFRMMRDEEEKDRRKRGGH